MVTPENRMSEDGLHALRDLVELRMYLVAQSQHKPWPLFPRSIKDQRKSRKPYKDALDPATVAELQDQGFLESTSNRTFVVSKSGYQFYERAFKNRIPA